MHDTLSGKKPADVSLKMLQSRLNLQKALINIQRVTGRLLRYFKLELGAKLELQRDGS